MQFQLIDWILLCVVGIFFVSLAFFAMRYNRSTVDFLAANRSAGRYLLTLAEGIAGLGAITIIGTWQVSYKVGFGSNWWGNLSGPVGLIMVLTGWVIYRYRETRVLTLPQLFEIRYSRNFRILAGGLCWFSGILNFGIFPAIGAAFFERYCNLSPLYTFCLDYGFTIHTFSLTYVLLIVSLVGISIFFTFSGGQIAVLITDFFQSVFCSVIIMIIVAILLIRYPLNDVFDGMKICDEGKSMLNPFESGNSEFSPTYFLIGILGAIFNRLSWQGNQGYNCSAKTPHEAKMAGILQQFRGIGLWSSLAFVAYIAYMFMHHPAYVSEAQKVNAALAGIDNLQVRDQMLVPMSMAAYLPVGMVGLFAAMMFAAFISTHDTYLHSWGSIFIQDVYMPIREKIGKPEMNTTEHIRKLRISVVMVGVFICLFSIFYPQKMPILMFFAITASIWLGGVGAVMIGALYTKWGKTGGAYAALISGSVISFTGIIADQLITDFTLPISAIYTAFIIYAILAVFIIYLIFNRSKQRKIGGIFAFCLFLCIIFVIIALEYIWPQLWSFTNPASYNAFVRMNGQRIYFFAMLTSIEMYSLFSLLGEPETFNLEKLLNRGKYAMISEHKAVELRWQVERKGLIRQIFGITADFSRFDYFLYWATIVKSLVIFLTFVVVTVAAMIGIFKPEYWPVYHKFWFWFWIVLSFVIAVWLIVGGFSDFLNMVYSLKTAKRDYADDGRVYPKIEIVAYPSIKHNRLCTTKLIEMLHVPAVLIF